MFSIPKRLGPYFRYDRKLCGILFRAAWRSLSECLRIADAEPALVLTLQTAGEALNWNPHLHGMLADGAFLGDGTFKPFDEINLKVIQDRFAELVLSEFVKRELITDEVMSQVLSQEHTGFSVWMGEPFGDEESDKFVARYVERGPLSLDKLSVVDGLVVYAIKEGSTHEFDALEFLALLSSHIPNTYESITRYYGHYSCRARGERRKHALVKDEDDIEELPELKVEPSSYWARCIKQVYEVDPLECPKCKGQMRIVAFVQDSVAITKIMQSLGLPDYTAPPPLAKNRTADFEQYCLDEIPDYENFDA